jgi:hypothetical protein
MTYHVWSDAIKVIGTQPLQIELDGKTYTCLRDHPDANYRCGKNLPSGSFEIDLPPGFLPNRARRTTFIPDTMTEDNKVFTVQADLVLEDQNQVDDFIKNRILAAGLGYPNEEEAKNWVPVPKPPLGKIKRF